MQGAALGGFEHAKDRIGMRRQRHRHGKNTQRGKTHCRETSREDFLYFEAEAGHAAKQRGRCGITASSQGMNFPGRQ